MKIVRSVKYSLKFQTSRKREMFETVLDEYSKSVQFFIDLCWREPKLSKKDFKKDILDLNVTWLSQRLKQCAARQALAVVKSTRARKKKKPTFKGNSMMLSSNCCVWEENKSSIFDAWIH